MSGAYPTGTYPRGRHMLYIARRIEPSAHWYLTNESGQWMLVRDYNREKSPVTGFFRSLTPAQKRAALEYTGAENHGREE
jgi:hypothetical protein